MILVTGATGHFGSATIRFLLNKGVSPEQIIALVRNEDIATNLKELAVRTVVGDYNDYNSLLKAFAGVEQLVFVSGSDIKNRVSQHKNVVNAAKECGIQHIVYTSFQRKNETESSPLWLVAQSHLETEKWIKDSGMKYTILRNNLYMDFIPAFVGEQVLETGVIYLPAGNGKVSAVLREELAEATANSITDNVHQMKEYDFTNFDAFTYADVAAIISEISGKTIQYISPSPTDYATTLAQYGVPNDIIGLFSSFAIAQAEGELDIESGTLEQILGRKPTTIKAFLKSVYSTGE
jgi:NAD(P)H dehydrogenase (quinone)